MLLPTSMNLARENPFTLLPDGRESTPESIKRHENFLALQLGLKKRMKVLDVGCAISGPLREIARFRKYGLDANTTVFIGHALALHRDDRYLDEPALDTVKKRKVKTLESVGLAPTGSGRVS